MNFYRFKQYIKLRLAISLGKYFNISFARSGDDLQILKLLNTGAPGLYVDVGSWHPIKSSNTFFFYLRQWKGICIDPNPDLKTLYSKLRPRDVFINAGVGDNNQTLTYYVLKESSMNTFSKSFITDNNYQNQVIKEMQVPIRPLKLILKEHIKKTDRLDFFDIDAEGFDLEVLKTNDWELYRPKVIIIESDLSIKKDLKSEIVSYLESKYYRLVGKTIISSNLGNLIFLENKNA